MSERLFERPERWRRSVVREPGRRGGGVISTLKPYKPYIIMGVAMLAVFIAYQLYSRRASQQKDATQIQTGLGAIGGASAQNRPSLQVDPQVIEGLQNQVLSYQEQVAELEEALSRSNRHMQSLLGPQQQGPPQDAVTAQMMAAAQQQQQNQFTGLHGQMPPPQQQQQRFPIQSPPMDPSMLGGMPTRGGPPAPPGPAGSGGASAFGGGSQAGMGAFASSGPAPAVSGMGSAMGGSDFNSGGFSDGVASMAMQMSGNPIPGKGGGGSY